MTMVGMGLRTIHHGQRKIKLGINASRALMDGPEAPPYQRKSCSYKDRRSAHHWPLTPCLFFIYRKDYRHTDE